MDNSVSTYERGGKMRGHGGGKEGKKEAVSSLFMAFKSHGLVDKCVKYIGEGKYKIQREAPWLLFRTSTLTI